MRDIKEMDIRRSEQTHLAIEVQKLVRLPIGENVVIQKTIWKNGINIKKPYLKGQVIAEYPWFIRVAHQNARGELITTDIHKKDIFIGKYRVKGHKELTKHIGVVITEEE